MNNIFFAVIPYLLFAFVAAVLCYPRFSNKVTYSVWGVVCALIFSVHLGIGLKRLDNSFLIALMPLTAYLPTAICYFILSKRNFSSEIFVLLTALLGALTVVLTRKSAINLAAGSEFVGLSFSLTVFFGMLAFAVILGFVSLKFLRESLNREVLVKGKSAVLQVPLLLLEALSLYELNSTADISVLIMLTVTDISVLALLTAYLYAKMCSARAEMRKVEIEKVLELERDEFVLREQRAELDRQYRHDIRHHIAAMKGMLERGEDVGGYLESLDNKMTKISSKRYSANPLTDAVLSAAFGKAEALGVKLEADIAIPEEMPFEETDICSLLSNLLENALNELTAIIEAEKGGISSSDDDVGIEKTVERVPEAKLNVDISLTDGKFSVEIVNSARHRAELGTDGLPKLAPHGHGIGLRSVKHIVEKHSGVMKIHSDETSFGVFIIIFAEQGSKIRDRKSETIVKKSLYCTIGVLATILGAAVLLNGTPATLNVLAESEFLKPFVEILDFREYEFDFGDSGLSSSTPSTDNEEVNNVIDEFISDCKSRFAEAVALKDLGYVGMEIASEIPLNDGNYFILKLFSTMNIGSSSNVTKYYVFDRALGRMIEPEDLFIQGSAWNETISAFIAEEIERRHFNDSYEGVWAYYGYAPYTSETDLQKKFSSLSAVDPSEYSFYFDIGNESLTIHFSEAVVSPTSEVEFSIPLSELEPFLVEDSPLRRYIK